MGGPWSASGRDPGRCAVTVHIRPFEADDADVVVALWREAGLLRPWNDPYRDIERKQRTQPELFLVAEDEVVVGSVMAGYDGHRGWLYYLAVASARRGEGIARALVGRAEQLLLRQGCPKVQLMVRPDNAPARGLYAALGDEPFDTWATGKRLIADD